MEIAQVLRRARAEGLEIEIHGRSMVASGAVIVLGAGTPGRRFIARNSYTLLHGIQYGNGFSYDCFDGEEEEGEGQLTPAQDVSIRRLLGQIIVEQVLAGVKPLVARKAWTACEGEYIGNGQMLVDLGVADKVEG